MFVSDSNCKVGKLHSSKRDTGSSNDPYQYKPMMSHSMETFPQLSTMPSRNFSSHNRIQLEVKQEGPEFHKENLLSLPFCRHDKQIQSPEVPLSSSHCVGNPQCERVLTRLKDSKLPPSLDVHCAQRKLLSPLVLQGCHSHLTDSHSLLNAPFTSDIEHSSQQGTVGKGSLKRFASLPASEACEVKCASDKQNSEPYKLINLQFLPSCGNVQLNLHRMVAPSDVGYQNIIPSITNATSAKSPLNISLPLVSPSQGGAVRCMQASKVRICYSEHYEMDDERVQMQQEECSLAKQVESVEREASSGKRAANFFIGDVPPNERKLEQPVKKWQAISQQMSNALIGRDAIQSSAQPLNDSCMQQVHWGQEHMEKQCERSEGTCLEMQMETTDTNTALDEKHEHIAGMEISPERQLLKLPKAVSNKIEVASTLFAFPAYAQMPNTVSTFSTGEPSLPLCSEIDRKLLEQVDNGNNLKSVDTSDVDWGKFLALSAPVTVKVTDKAVSNLLPYQQRFQYLQVFLKACDEFDQNSQMQALWSLSAAARSGYAVELETRAIRLSLEEGKEMHRVKLLNVLGKHDQRNESDVGATPYGPRLPAPGANAMLKHL